METDTICLNLIYIHFNRVLNIDIVFIEFQHKWNYLLRSVFSWWRNYNWCFWRENVTLIIRLRRKGIFPLWTSAIRQPLKKYFPWFIELINDFLFYQTGDLLRNIIHVHVYNFIPMTKSTYMTLNPVLAELLKAGFAGILF